MFLEDEFSEEDFFAGLHQQSISQVLEKLNSGLGTIELSITSSISRHLEDLIKQTVQVAGVEHDAQSLLSDCILLKSTFDCMYSSVTNPIAKIKNLVRNAEGAYERAGLLRSVLRFVQLCTKAKQSISNSAELPRIATILCEISNIVVASDLIRIDSLRNDYNWVHQQVSSLRTQAEVLLKSAMLQNNQVQISSALQVAYNLSTLSTVVETVTKEVRMDFMDGVAHLCDNTKLFSPQVPHAKDPERSVSSNQVRTIIWQRLESVFDLLFDTITCMHALYSVLDKKSDPVTRRTYNEIIGNDLNFLIDNALGHFDFMKTKLSTLADSSKTVSNILIEEFPRLYDVCESCWQRGLSRLLPPDARFPLFRVIETFQDRYLTDRVEKIQGPISLMFPSGIAAASAAVPTTSDVSTVLNYMMKTLSSLESRTDLQRFVIKGFSGPLNLCVSKIEALIGNEPEASPLLWSSTKVERLNAILSITAHLESELSALVNGKQPRCRLLSKEVSEPLLRSVIQNVNNIGHQILNPVFALSQKNLERALQTESSINSVLQSELERNKSILLKLNSKPRFLWMYMSPFIAKVENIVLYRIAALLSSGLIRESRIQQVCEQLIKAEEILKDYSALPDPFRKGDFVYPPKGSIVKLPLFRSWISSGIWRRPNRYEIAAIPKIIFVCCSIGVAQNLVSMCDLLCMTPIKLYQWLVSHSETEAMTLCRDHVIMSMVADSELSKTVLHFITDLVDNKL